MRIFTAAFVVGQPGYTDAYYYLNVAQRLARGEGLSADFVWNFIEAGHLESLPIPSHRFWLPLASVEQAIGIKLLGSQLGAFRSAQVVVIALSAFVPAITYAAALSLQAPRRAALAAAALAGICGGFFAPAWVTLDSFAAAAMLGTIAFISYAGIARGAILWGVVGGLAVGILYLARAEGALFGVAFLFMIPRTRSRIPALSATAVALGIGIAWFGRGLTLGGAPDLIARTVLLGRYEEFFALHVTTGVDLGTLVSQRANAIVFDIGVLALTLLGFLIFPLILAARVLWPLPQVRAFAGLGALVLRRGQPRVAVARDPGLIRSLPRCVLPVCDGLGGGRR